MKKIVVLIDFTEGSKIALKQACQLASKNGATIYVLNVVDSPDKSAQAEQALAEFIELNATCKVQAHAEVGVGNLFTAIPSLLKKIEPDLVIICTHGIKGMFQHLFGAHILKLVQTIDYPTIVVQENNKINFAEIDKILMPIGPHPDFSIKVEQTAAMAKALNAEVVVYEIDRDGFDSGDHLMDKNRNLIRQYFDEHQVAYSKKVDDLKVISAGFSRQTLEYASEEKISLISLMSTVSKDEVVFGVGDKENFLVNTYGIPILCCNA
jgi:nucleotide-binding universal stress UspA family protein